MTRTDLSRTGGLAGLLLALLAAALLMWAGPARAQVPGLPNPPAFADEPAPEVAFSITPSTTTAGPNDQVVLAVVIDHAPGWHTWPNKPVLPPALADVTPIPTVITLSGPPASISHVGPVQYPPPDEVPVAFGTEPVTILSYKDRAVAYLPVIIAPDAPAGPLELTVQVRHQACDEHICLMPTTATVTTTLRIEPGAAPTPTDESLFASFEPSVFARMLAGEVSADAAPGDLAEFDFFGAKFNLQSNAYLLILPIALVAGFLLNLTPCVLPVIPLKILSLQKQAGNPAKLVLFGSVYCVGIIATFAVLGLLILGLRAGAETQDWGQIFSSAWFSLAMAIIVGVMGLGMMGLFTISLPKGVYMVNPAGDTVQGNFMMGVLTAILSTPCTGPFLGATIAWASTQPRWLGFATFLIMGVGMALPYALLILFPKLIDRMPRSGPGGELLKQVMGVVLLAVAAFLASNLTGDKWPWFIVGGLAGLACLWALVGGWIMLRTRTAKVVVSLAALLSLTGTVFATRALVDEGPIPWVEFSPEAFEQARADGRTIVIEFTAKWCTNCHVLEKTVLNVDPARTALNRADVVPFKVDLTSEANEVGWAKLREVSGGSGIPLTAVYRPGEDEPIVFRSFYTGTALVEAIGPR